MASIRWCDGSHRTSFQTGGFYTSPTTGEFNMCNCTRVTGSRGPFRPGLSHRVRDAHPHSRTDPLTDPRTPPSGPESRPTARFWFSRPRGPGEARESPGRRPERPAEARSGTKKIALDPAESSAIDTTAPVGHRYDARWGRRPSSGARGGRLGLGDLSAARMVMLCCCIAVLLYCCETGCVRPRCAAAEYPQAVRGPQPRGTGDVHRACGWT